MNSRIARRPDFAGEPLALVLVTLALLVGGGIAAWSHGPENLRLSPEVETEFSNYTRQIGLLQPEPRERLLFLVSLGLLTATSVGVLLIGRGLRGRSRESGDHAGGRLARRAEVALALAPAAGLIFTWRAAWWGEMFGAWLIGWLGAMVAVASLALTWGLNRRGPRGGRRARRGMVWGATGALAVVIAATRVVGAEHLDLAPRWTVHLDALLFAMNEIVRGGTALVDVFPQYGLYGEFLAPLFRVLPWSVFSFLAVMGALVLATYALLADVLARHLVGRVWRALALVALMPLIANIFYQASNPAGWDLYLQYHPLRLIFPAAAVWLIDRGGRWSVWRRALAIGGLAGLAAWWNLDSGVPVLGAWVALGLSRLLGPDAQDRAAARRELAVGGLVALALMGGVWVALAGKAGAWPSLGAMFRYQRIFYATGFAMLPMPGVGHPWQLVAGVYVAGLVTALGAIVRGVRGRIWPTILYLSVLGLGLFSYYQGRSHDYVLIAVVWPAFMIAALLGERVVRGVRAGLLGSHWRLTTAAVGFVFLLLALRWAEQIPTMIAVTRSNWSRPAEGGAIGVNVRFLRERTRPGEAVYVLARGQAIYLTEAGLRGPRGLPGLVELILRTNHLELLRRLEVERPPRLFVADDFGFFFFPELDPDLRGLLARHYRATGVSAAGLRCYEAIDGPPENGSPPRPHTSG